MAGAAPERFQFRDGVLRAAASRLRRRLLLTLAATAAVVLAMYEGALRRHGAGWGTLAFALGLLLALAALTFGRRMRRLHARWSSFSLSLDDIGIERIVSGFPPMRIARADVVELEEVARGIVVRDRAGRGLLVPREIEGYERIRAALVGWRGDQIVTRADTNVRSPSRDGAA